MDVDEAGQQRDVAEVVDAVGAARVPGQLLLGHHGPDPPALGQDGVIG
jgi:hypothetical protein